MNYERDLKEAGRTLPGPEQNLPCTMSARMLQTTTFPPISWVAEGLLPEGLSILAGKPKLGKSWLALQLGYAVSTGGDFLGRNVTEGNAFYAALEDNNRRLKARLERMTQSGQEWPENFDLTTEWPRLDVGGLQAAEAWHDRNPSCKLMIFDTLATIRPATKTSDSQYSGDYAAMRGLHNLANDRGIAIVVIHHVRKAEADDPFDTVSGSTGLTGAADSTLILTKSSGDCTLYGRGRDLEEFEAAVEFDPETCRWSDLGLPSLAHASDTKRAIYDAMAGGMQTPAKISEVSGINYELCAKTLQRMLSSGEITKDGRSCYSIITDPLSNVSNCPEGGFGDVH